MATREFERLRWRCRRGLLELDIVLHEFLEQNYVSLTPAERAAFERLLASPDPLLQAYLFGGASPEDPEINELVKKII